MLPHGWRPEKPNEDVIDKNLILVRTHWSVMPPGARREVERPLAQAGADVRISRTKRKC